MAFEELDLSIADVKPATPDAKMYGTAAATYCVSISHCTFSNTNCAAC